MPEIDYRAQRQEAQRLRHRRGVFAASAFAVVAVVLLVAFGVIAGQGGQGGVANRAAGGSAATGTAAGGGAGAGAASTDRETHTVVDSEGRSVQVPVAPTRIACFDSFSGEAAIMAGAGERICGVPAGVRSDVLLQQKAPNHTSWISLSGNAVNIETLMSAGCDVALVRPALSDAERAKLSNAGIPYVVVGYDDVPSQIAALRLVGLACGEDAAAAAERIAAFAETMVADIERRVAAVSEGQRVRVYHAINDVLTCDGAGSLGADWVARVACVDVSAGQAGGNQGDYQASLEQIYAWAPDVVICNALSSAHAFQEEARWAALPAVSREAVWVIPTGATRWGQRGSVETYLAMLWLGKQVYPQLFADVNFEKTVRDYYYTYLGLEMSDEQWSQVVAGTGIRAEGAGGGGSGAGGGAGAGAGAGGGAGAGAGAGAGSGSHSGGKT